MAKINGKALRTRVNGHTIALATSCSLQTTAQMSDSKTKDDPVGPHNDVEYVDWTINSENILGANEGIDTQEVYDTLMEFHLSGTEVDVSVELMANATEAVPAGDWTPEKTQNKAFSPYGGKALIESVQLNAPVEGKATVSVSFKANSTLKKITTAQA